MRPGTLLSVSAVISLAACGGGGGGNAMAPGSSTPTSVARFAGDSQVAPVSTALAESLAVVVTDSAGHPVPGITVAWSPTGGGSVAPTSSLTDASGIARTFRTLGAIAGVAGTTVTTSGLPAVHFTQVGQVQGGVTMASHTVGTLTDTVLGTLIDPEPRPSVLVTDQSGTAVAGVNVIWTAGGGGAVTTATVPTDVNGVSTVGYTFGLTAGTGYVAHATVTGLLNSPVNFTLAATPGHPFQLLKTTGDTVLATPGTLILQTVHVTDAHGNNTPGIAIDWLASSGGGSVSPAHDTTDATGVASSTRTLGATIGAQATTATATSSPGSPATAFTTTTTSVLVKVANNFFNPVSDTLVAGDSVAWQWQGVTALHTLTFTPATGVPANEPNRSSGLVWRVFTTAGTYSYHCSNHAGMNGSITVTP